MMPEPHRNSGMLQAPFDGSVGIQVTRMWQYNSTVERIINGK